MTYDLVFTGEDRQLHISSSEGEAPRALTLDLASNPLMMWGQPQLQRTSWSWPCWSPDGTKIAAFELPDDDDVSGPARVHVLDTDGVRQLELLELSGRVPVYCAWQPDGRGLAVLMQEDNQLVLGYARPAQPGVLRAIEEGSPLFFAWAPDGRRMLVHAGVPGAASGGRVIVRDPQGELPDVALPCEPGGFCAPVVFGEHVAHVERRGAVSRLVLSDDEGEGARTLLEYQGLGAILPAADGRLLFSAAPGGQGTPYRGVTSLDPRGGPPERLTNDDCLAFFPTPSGGLVYAQVNTERNCLTWHVARRGGDTEELAAFWPTREMLFALHFFDQFAQSHHLVSPDGRHLAYAGFEVGSTRGRDKGRVKLLDLEAGGAPRDVAGGDFACFSPKPR